jgi:MarR family transcriptional regulator, lower aerobic nicotinate degradation pathway regulator
MIQVVNGSPPEEMRMKKIGPGAYPDDECTTAPHMPLSYGSYGRLAFILFQVGEAVAWAADEILPNSGLDARGYCILAILSADGPGSQQELAQLLGLGPGVMVAEIDQLERKGFVERNRDPSDRRRSRVTLTSQGVKTLAEADGMADELAATLLGGLDDTERAQLLALLTKGLRLEPPANTAGAS